MSRLYGYPLAVQRAALRAAGSHVPPRLAFVDGSGWQHLQRFVALAGELGSMPADAPAPLAGAAAALAHQAAHFGPPAALHDRQQAAADALAGSSMPMPLLAALAWFVARLQMAAQRQLELQHALLAAGVTAGARRDGLQLLGQEALHARAAGAPLLEGLAGLKPALLAATADLARAAAHGSAALQAQQESLGRQQASSDALAAQIARLGLFGAHKKAALEAQLLALQRDTTQQEAAAEALRGMLGRINLLLSNGAWLEPAFDELLAWLEALRTAWSALGSGVSQLAADAGEQQLADDAWLAGKLDSASALPLWQQLAAAAQAFPASAGDGGAGELP